MRSLTVCKALSHPRQSVCSVRSCLYRSRTPSSLPPLLPDRPMTSSTPTPAPSTWSCACPRRAPTTPRGRALLEGGALGVARGGGARLLGRGRRRSAGAEARRLARARSTCQGGRAPAPRRAFVERRAAVHARAVATQAQVDWRCVVLQPRRMRTAGIPTSPRPRCRQRADPTAPSGAPGRGPPSAAAREREGADARVEAVRRDGAAFVVERADARHAAELARLAQAAEHAPSATRRSRTSRSCSRRSPPLAPTPPTGASSARKPGAARTTRSRSAHRRREGVGRRCAPSSSTAGYARLVPRRRHARRVGGRRRQPRSERADAGWSPT